jgi:hypothetical protein
VGDALRWAQSLSAITSTHKKRQEKKTPRIRQSALVLKVGGANRSPRGLSLFLPFVNPMSLYLYRMHPLRKIQIFDALDACVLSLSPYFTP